MKNSKEFTSPQPHKVIKEMSLFLGKFEAQPNNEGWSFSKILSSGVGYMKVTSIKKVNAHDGKMFDFAMSNLYAQRHHLFKGKMKDKLRTVDTTEAYNPITIDMREILKFRGMKNRTENKKAILKSFKNMVGMTVEINNSKTNLIYSILSSVKVDEANPNILHIKVNDEINEAFYKATIRFINIEKSLPLRSDIAVEFTKFLQTRGQGIRGNIPSTPKDFKHSDAVYFLHLEKVEEKEQLRIIRRAIKAVERQGYSIYRMERFNGEITWRKS